MKQSNEISNMNQSTQQPQLSISAWMDGDSETDMPEDLLNKQGQETWDLYHLIGDTLRTPELALPSQHSLQARIAQQIKDEPSIVAAPKPQAAQSQVDKGKMQRWSKAIWPGVAMAAAVASVIWVAKPFVLPEYAAPAEQVAEAMPTPARMVKEVALNTPVVRDYVSAHRQISGPANVRQVSYGATR